MSPSKTKRMVMMIIGILLLGFAVSLFRISSFGTDPFTTMNLGVSGFLGMQFGVYQLIINIGLFIIVWFYARQCIGLGTIVNMVFIGFIADFFVYGYNQIIGDALSFPIRTVLLMAAVVIACMAVSLYMTADLGIAPYDAIAIIIQNVTNNKVSFAWARIILDVTSVGIGFSFGAIVGVGTLIMAFFTGPLVQLFRFYITDPMLRSHNRPALETNNLKLKRRTL